MRRYQIYWARLDPVQGGEMAKTRPAVVVSRDELNAILPTVTVCPLTTRLHPTWRTRLACKVSGQAAEIVADQIRTVSKSRLGKAVGRLSPQAAAALRGLLTEMYGQP